MVIPSKKLQNGFEMPVYGLGTWEMGGKRTRDLQNDDTADIQAISTAIELGVTHIDTAELYADGHTEELIGEAIKQYQREKLFLVSKVRKEHLSYTDVMNAAKASLARIGTSYLDLYLIHAPSLSLPIEETMRAMDTLVQDGLVKNIGVSNFNVEEMQEAQSHTKNKIVANQVHFNLKYREVEKRGVVEYCQRKDIMVIAWRPLQKGILLEENTLMRDLANKYQKTLPQIALQWLVAQPNIVTISKTRSKEHLTENLGALDWHMDASDVEMLRKEFPNQEIISDAVPLH